MFLPICTTKYTTTMSKQNKKLSPISNSLIILLSFFHSVFSQKPCPNCGSTQIPYPLSTNHNCGDPNYTVRCDSNSLKLYFDALNGTSYRIIKILPSVRRLVVEPSQWIGDTCVTQDMQVSEGLWLNHALPFNVTSSNTIFLLNCSPRLLVSPLNCTPSSLCHRYLSSSDRVDPTRASQCSSGLSLCCTFLAGGMPSAYKIRLHSSGCKAFRSIMHLDSDKPVKEWEEGLEIQWSEPAEPVCKSQEDCSNDSKCSLVAKKSVFRCLCTRDYYWNSTHGMCSRRKKLNSRSDLTLKFSIGTVLFSFLCIIIIVVTVRKFRRFSKKTRLTREREEMLNVSKSWKSSRMFSLKEVKKATNGFSKDRILGIGGFGEVYKGELQDGTTVAVKAAKVGNIKSTQQVLNEVGILSQVNHKNLVRLLGCCIGADQPLMIYEYISKGTLHDHLHGKISSFLDWRTRLKIASQTAEALAYLHSSAYTPIYHRDIKSTNILLDDEFNAKVSDFGLSRLASPGLSHVSTCAQGTLGYLDPEYYRNYQLTDKSDVYSFGVVLLEILTSQRAIDFTRSEEDVNLAIYVCQRVTSGLLLEVVDPNLLGEEPSVELMTSLKVFCKLALTCLKEKKDERPSMKDVVQEIESIIESLDKEEASKEDSNIEIV